MSRLLERCKQFFNTDDLYEVLGVQKTASKKDLKKGYHKKSLLHHPDRAQTDNKEEATQKFQVLAQVHSVLDDDDKRAEYDETGVVSDETSVDQERDWDHYWRLLFPKITEQDIQEFSDNYKGSEEELSDLKRVYQDVDGDMAAILDHMMCSNLEDEDRFRQILTDLVEEGQLPRLDAFFNEPAKKRKARIAKAKKEAKEAKMMKKDNDEASLTALIAQRQASREQEADNFFAHLEAKYGGAGTTSKGKGKKKTGR